MAKRKSELESMGLMSGLSLGQEKRRESDSATGGLGLMSGLELGRQMPSLGLMHTMKKQKTIVGSEKQIAPFTLKQKRLVGGEREMGAFGRVSVHRGNSHQGGMGLFGENTFSELNVYNPGLREKFKSFASGVRERFGGGQREPERFKPIDPSGMSKTALRETLRERRREFKGMPPSVPASPSRIQRFREWRERRAERQGELKGGYVRETRLRHVIPKMKPSKLPGYLQKVQSGEIKPEYVPQVYYRPKLKKEKASKIPKMEVIQTEQGPAIVLKAEEPGRIEKGTRKLESSAARIRRLQAIGKPEVGLPYEQKSFIQQQRILAGLRLKEQARYEQQKRIRLKEAEESSKRIKRYAEQLRQERYYGYPSGGDGGGTVARGRGGFVSPTLGGAEGAPSPEVQEAFRPQVRPIVIQGPAPQVYVPGQPVVPSQKSGLQAIGEQLLGNDVAPGSVGSLGQISSELSGAGQAGQPQSALDSIASEVKGIRRVEGV